MKDGAVEENVVKRGPSGEYTCKEYYIRSHLVQERNLNLRESSHSPRDDDPK